MTGKANNLIILLCLVFIIDAAAGVSWIEDLRMEGKYGGFNCDARVTCYLYATAETIVTWTCRGCPLATFNKGGSPGIRVKGAEEYAMYKFRQTLVITKCFGKLTFTCSTGSSSKSITLTPGLSVGAIVGIVLAVIAVLCAIAGCVGVARRRKAQRTVAHGRVVMNPPPGAYPVQPQPMVYPSTQQAMPPPPYPGSK